MSITSDQIKSDWELGNYSAGGSDVKERVLTHEGVQLAALAGLRKQHMRFLGHGGDTFCIPGCGGAWEPVNDHREFHSVDEAMVAGYIAELNGKLNRWETVKKFAILPRDLSIEQGEITPSMKIKRRSVETTFSTEIDRMYSGSLAHM